MIDIEFQQKRELILNAIDIIQEIGQFTQIKPNGEARCPLPSHGGDDSHPSFHVYEDTQSWYCFAEGIGGNIIDFYMGLRNQPFWDIFKDLAQKAGIPLKDFTPDEKQKIEEQKTVDDILEDTTQFYVESLTDEAKNYLINERKLTEKTIEENRLGLSNGGLKNFLLNEKQYLLNLCLDSCVLKEFTKEDETKFIGDYFFEKRIIIPIINRGKVVHLIGRCIDGSELKYLLKSGQKTYLPGEENDTKKRVWIVEGLFDWLIAKQRGIPAVSLVGTHLDLEKAKKIKSEEVIIALDPDKAGIDAIIDIGKLFGERAKVFLFPEGQDPDQYILSSTDEDIEKTLAELPSFYSYWISSIDPKTDKKLLLKKLEPILRQLSLLDEVLWEVYLDEIKTRFTLSSDERSAYKKLLAKYRKQREDTQKNQKAKDISEGSGISGALDGVYSANFPGLIDIVSFNSKPAFLIKQHENLLIQSSVAVNGTTYIPPLQEHIPWMLPHGEEVVRIYSKTKDNSLLSDNDLYDEVSAYYRIISELPSETYYDVLTAWTFHTYQQETVQYTPIICPFAVPERGKSRTGKAMTYLAYRGTHVEVFEKHIYFGLLKILMPHYFLMLKTSGKRQKRKTQRIFCFSGSKKAQRLQESFILKKAHLKTQFIIEFLAQPLLLQILRLMQFWKQGQFS
jgi:DNA primase catalytic core